MSVAWSDRGLDSLRTADMEIDRHTASIRLLYVVEFNGRQDGKGVRGKGSGTPPSLPPPSPRSLHLEPLVELHLSKQMLWSRRTRRTCQGRWSQWEIRVASTTNLDIQLGTSQTAAGRWDHTGLRHEGSTKVGTGCTGIGIRGGGGREGK
ncbi:hypothetical protein N7510_009423 [Penicillium lagena]|uniref:uncharacterized protein n=1 Tax=Penicillium lagena TaxID=94218 RepID=UPI00254179F1|nr:uncharacterized protein N7510_009423 [Penicillium lagena]KAJ5606642.1 hypothetical protein N7510_009423 [Penicillium lagena]